jgi:membrane protein
VDCQPADSAPGVCIDAWRRYRAVQGPLQSALLSLYIFVAILPALLVMEGYLENDPGALAKSMVEQYGLSTSTGDLVANVFSHGKQHHLGATLFAVAGALFVGINFGRVFQDVHARAWEVTLPAKRFDYPRYLAALLGLYGLILLMLFQARELQGEPSWAGLALVPGWIAVLTLYFQWIKRMLTYKLVPARDMLRVSLLTATLIVAVVVISSRIMEYWINLYSDDYGVFGVVIAIFFWIGFSSAIIVLALSLGPSLAGRKRFRHPHAPVAGEGG